MRKLRTKPGNVTRYRDVIRAVVALALAAAFIKTGAAKLPPSSTFTDAITATLGTKNEASSPGSGTVARPFFSERGQPAPTPPPARPDVGNSTESTPCE